MAKNATLKLRIEGVPEALWGLAHGLAEMLRAEAEGEPEHVARKLREIAARFEAGMAEGGDL